MKTFLTIIILSFCTYFSQAQTVAEKPEFIKFMNYCQTPIEVTCHMEGAVSLVKYQEDYADLVLYYVQPVTANWLAKYPFVIKWYPVSQSVGINIDTYQQRIIAYFKVNVPRVYCTSKTAYLELFRAHWKNGDMQSGWFDSHYLPMTVKF